MKAILLFLCCIHWALAIPKFNLVNDRFYNGTQCPSIQQNIACPSLCVGDLSLCPASVGPDSCETGKTLCMDGTCRDQCSPDLKSPCACRSSTRMACRSIHTEILNYHPENATAQTYASCSFAIKLDHTLVSTWSVPKDPMIWNVCNTPAGIVFPIGASWVIAYLAAHLGFIVLWSLWLLYKSIREQNYTKSHPPLDEIIEKIVENKVDHHQPEWVQTGYKKNWIGLIMVFYMICLSVFWMIVLLVLSLDYYGYVNGTPFGLFYDSYDLSSKAFCLAWFLSTSWYLVINLARTKILNHFRIRVRLECSDYVEIKRMYQHQTQAQWSRVEAMARQRFGFDHMTATVPVLRDPLGSHYFEFQSTRYTLDQNQFVPAKIMITNNPSSLVQMKGLESNIAKQRLEKIGPNFISVQVPSFLEGCWQELTGFFYIYQLMILWCYFYLAYWQIGISDTCVILLAAIIKVVVRLRSEKRVKRMAEHVDSCEVFRDEVWLTVSTAELVPGDLVKITSHLIIPADMVVLKGDVVIDESSLTGEPLPIRKFALRADAIGPFDSSFKSNSLFAGTTVKQASEATALVLKTRTDTDKGQLVQRILFPEPVSFVFQEQLKIVFCLLLVWAIVLLVFGVWWLGGTGMTAWFYGTICAAQVMNPLLPAILVVGQSIASNRLRKLSVFCVDLPRILMAGKVQVFCFDKTGTLTKEGLEYHGVCPIQERTLGELTEYDALPWTIKLGLAACHSVTQVEGQYIGNPVDIVLFETTGAELTQSDTVTLENKTIRILQQFEFQHARASMSVAVKDVDTGHIHLFCKGSFERIAEITQQVPGYHALTSQQAKEGCYILALAHRDLGVLSADEESSLLQWTRDQLESNLELCGLLLLKNQLRPDTAQAIEQLKQGDVRTVMITGDNAFTGICIGQQCGLVPPQTVLLGDLAQNEKTGENYVRWIDVGTEQETEPLPDSELALTGNAFRWLNEQSKIRDYLFQTRVFARMTPVDKMVCVELMMEKAMTAMCGDGGNDCGALRSAHVGIALSEAEASVVSPFSTPRRSIQACVDLLIQGRSALATSFASYKYLILYGQTMATVKFCTFYYTMSFSQWNFILIDAFITVFCSLAVTRAGAAKTLSSHRPTARILGPEVLLSALGQLWINAWFLIGSFVWLYTKDDFFRCREWDARAIDNSKWWLLGDSFEADVLTFVALFQFINSAFVFNYGYIFRQSWYRNYFLIGVWALFIAIVSYWELADPNTFGCLMRVNCGNPDVLVSLGYPRPDFYIEPYNNPLGHNVLPRYFRYQLWVYSICNMLAGNLWERFVILGPVRQYFRRRYSQKKIDLKH